MSKRTITAPVITTVLLLAGVAIGGFFVIRQGGSQTVGGVTVNRPAGSVEVKEVEEPAWNQTTLSPIIGKAYRINRIKADADPIRVEFAYDPAKFPGGISESDLRLFKWHEEGGSKYWAPVKSEVDTKRHVVAADLTSFSILAIRAPVAAYLTPGEIQSITAKLKEMQDSAPRYTCGVLISVDEELVAPDLNYSRGEVEAHDCRNTESVKNDDAVFYFNREQDGKSFVYALHALVEWHMDPSKSIVLEGTVKDKSGRPVKDAEIFATKIKYDRLDERTTTDQSGSYNIGLHAGRYSVRVEKKKPKCVSDKWEGDLCLWGLLAGPAIRQDKWNKDFAVDCPEYVIDENQTITSEMKIMGLVSQEVSDFAISGYQQTKSENGFGWEGVWKMTVNTKNRSGLAKRSITIEGQTLTIPNIATKSAITHEFDFSIPSRPAVGSVLTMPGKPVAKDDAELKFEAGPVTSSGPGGSLTVHKEEYVDDEFNLAPVTLTGKFVEVREDGATIVCNPIPPQRKGLTLRIRGSSPK